MEVWLALFGLVAAIAMIWMSRSRHRRGTSSDGTTGTTPMGTGGKSKDHHGGDGDAGSDGGGGGD